MPFKSFAEEIIRTPSLTTWTRLEPLPRQGSMQRSLQAQIRDPAWLLARQWQVGEFLGDDAGSPVQATLGVEMRSVTTYRPGADDAATVAIDQTVPVEVHVERERVVLRLRGAVQHGLHFENLVRQASGAGADPLLATFRATFAIVALPPDPGTANPDAARFRTLAAGRVTDGEALYAAAKAGALPPAASAPGMPAVIAAFVAYRESLFSVPGHDSAWRSQQLDYQFALESPAKDQDIRLDAADFPGGHLDWYSFSAARAEPRQITQENPADVTLASFDFLPNHVVFRGMPDSRWWNFEDAVTDFGQLDAEHVDLAKLLVMEFSLIYGNDWFSVPVPITVGISGSDDTPRGTLSRVTSLVVTDTFGLRTSIRPSEQTQVAAGESPWSMYKLAGPGTRSDFILMAPTLGVCVDGEPLEEVLFLRDDMAAMAWAVEHRLQGDLDASLDACDLYLARIKADPPPGPPVAVAGGPKIYYTLETTPPYNWIPLVPVRSPQGELLLRRGSLEIPTSAGFEKLKARALILEPEHPFFVADRAVSMVGAQVDRYFRYTRSSDGTIFLWLARKSLQGRGPGWSGLRFDTVRDMKAPEQA